jgi:hypothetical protein
MIFYLMTVSTYPCPCQTEPALSYDSIGALGAIVGVALSFVRTIFSMQEKRKDKNEGF